MSSKRDKLLEAISNNVRYIALLNESNSAELRLTKDKLKYT